MISWLYESSIVVITSHIWLYTIFCYLLFDLKKQWRTKIEAQCRHQNPARCVTRTWTQETETIYKSNWRHFVTSVRCDDDHRTFVVTISSFTLDLLNWQYSNETFNPQIYKCDINNVKMWILKFCSPSYYQRADFGRFTLPFIAKRPTGPVDVVFDCHKTDKIEWRCRYLPEGRYTIDMCLFVYILISKTLMLVYM